MSYQAALRVRGMLVVLSGLAVVFFVPDCFAQFAENWKDDPPAIMVGQWAENGACDSKYSDSIYFTRGGYRWRKSDGTWGFARGKYNYNQDDTNRAVFKVKRATGDPSDNPYDMMLSVDGGVMTKRNHAGNTTRIYKSCSKQDSLGLF